MNVVRVSDTGEKGVRDKNIETIKANMKHESTTFQNQHFSIKGTVGSIATITKK